MKEHFRCRNEGDWTVVEFLAPDMTDLVELESIHNDLTRHMDTKKAHHIILDFAKVKFVSSKALVIVLDLSKKLGALPHSRLVLCSVPPTIMELLKTLRLDRILKIVGTQKEAIALAAPA